MTTRSNATPGSTDAIQNARQELTERNKEDQKSSRGFAWLLAFAFGLAAAILGGFAYLFDEHQPEHTSTIGIMLMAVFLLLLAVITPGMTIALRRARTRHSELSLTSFDSIDQAAAEIHDDALGKLISFNFRLMDRFVSVALGQAKAAYLFCAASASAALLVLLAGATTLIAATTTSAQISVGVLSVAGAALSGYISVTFMEAYKLASRHMGYYYGQPLIHCYLLHAEWLAERAGHGDRELYVELQKQLLSATLGASRNAQEQLSDLFDLSPVPERFYPSRPDGRPSSAETKAASNGQQHSART
jgi:hypothetical protein